MEIGLARQMAASKVKTRRRICRAEPLQPTPDRVGAQCPIEGISALTSATRDMARAVRFYRTLGFESCSRRQYSWVYELPGWPQLPQPHRFAKSETLAAVSGAE
jgi:hypothetical protein